MKLILGQSAHGSWGLRSEPMIYIATHYVSSRHIQIDNVVNRNGRDGSIDHQKRRIGDGYIMELSDDELYYRETV